MNILVGVDGSGDQDTYDADFARSHVRTICNHNNFNTQYNRGPSMLGFGLEGASDSGYDFIMTRVRQPMLRNAPILLTGYSRGGTAVIDIANRLQKQKINVQAMMLFDCVDRHATMDATIIPDNVQHVCHAIRDPRANSRMGFDNAGLFHRGGRIQEVLDGTQGSYNKDTSAIMKKFFCTHGAMGGTYWKPDQKKKQNMMDIIDEGGLENTFAFITRGNINNRTNVTFVQDQMASTQVLTWVTPFLKYHGFVK